MEPLTKKQLIEAEEGILKLAKALNVSEREIIKILREGMESLSPIAGQLSKANKYFIDEMEAIFDCY